MFLVLPLLYFQKSEVSFAKNTFYAQVETNNVFFYSEPVADESKTLFELPKSYFVKLIDHAGENFYYSEYRGIYGYVKKTQVTPIDGTPITPYFTADFRAIPLSTLPLYTSPSTVTGSILTEIPHLTKNIIYYGSMNGEEAVPETSNEWYYCKYDNFYGYVYSVYCDKLTEFKESSEVFSKLENFTFDDEKPEGLSTIAMTFIIVGVSIPCLLVIYLLLKPTFVKEKVTNVKPKSKKRHGDYFEFDDSELN